MDDTSGQQWTHLDIGAKLVGIRSSERDIYNDK